MATEDRGAQVQRVKAANDIVDVIGTYVNLRPVGTQFKGLCPFHDDHHPSFTVDPRWQNYRCWACGKFGDVLTFVQEHEKVSFPEAMELLAQRAGITLEKTGDSQQNAGRALMLEVMRWAAEQFHRCLLDAPSADAARVYLGERRLSGETVRRFQLGYAPGEGSWLVQLAREAELSNDILEQVGLIAKRLEGSGYFDRFRDRVMFPIIDARGHVVGFGGRILPTSRSAQAAKYINSAETALFSKSENLYGIDQARQAGAQAGYLAVVEGYTDVLMAHQHGIGQVVATMGTALNARHIKQLRRYVPQVVLVFDADAGGEAGVNRALEVFVSNDMDLKVAQLPAGLDPCDLLAQQGAAPLETALTNAVDVLEFKMNRMLVGTADQGVEARRRAVDEVLQVIALAPEMPGQAGAVKRELLRTRISQRLGLKEETILARLRELRAAKRPANREPTDRNDEHDAGGEESKVKASRLELDLLCVLLADPALVAEAQAAVELKWIEHPRVRMLLEMLYRLQAEGEVPTLDNARLRIDNPALIAKALELQEVGRAHGDRPAWLRQILASFRERRERPVRMEIANQLRAVSDEATALELLRQVQGTRQPQEVKS